MIRFDKEREKANVTRSDAFAADSGMFTPTGVTGCGNLDDDFSKLITAYRG